MLQGKRRRNRSLEVRVLLLIAATVSKDVQNVNHAAVYWQLGSVRMLSTNNLAEVVVVAATADSINEE